jgi:NADH-quinone oxidoreductase subunit F
LRPDQRILTRCADRPTEELLGGEPPAPPPRAEVRCLAREPVVTRRLLAGGAADLDEARAHGVWAALEKALRAKPSAVLETMERSGERGRGGAGFPTAQKWRVCAGAPGKPKYVIANGDEGDPGSYLDRVLMEEDPHAVLEGMALCAYAVGASHGIVFIRSEYPRALTVMSEAIHSARAAGLLGKKILGSRFSFEVEVFPALGSYVCGEETAMLSAIEGFRGEVRLRPPFPAIAGLYGKPTVINNVETLVNVPWIVNHGAAAYQALGTDASPGTKALCFNHGFARPGIVEVEFGMPLHEAIAEAGGGADGVRLEAVIVGGPMGSVVFPEHWDVPICYGAMAARSLQLGHGGLVALTAGADLAALIVQWLEFFQDESCGKCVPCRLGSRRALELARRMAAGEAVKEPLERLLEVIAQASLCAFGRNVPRPVAQLLARLARHRPKARSRS